MAAELRADEIAEIGKAIARSGLYLQFVPQPTALETCWYTVGLTRYGHPELILFGLPPDISRPALQAVAEEIIAGRRVLTAGQRAGDILEGHQVELVAVTEPDRHLPVAAQFYEATGAVVEALQIVWPDRHHRWPWQPGTRVDDMPVLGRPTSAG
ncbi:hypothetical protein ACWT_3456 [Actinoplanes sp. SE50]|uniref:DUF4262 domain-containing protein n=1 Tax=unclassified Actinoplanes TaxID=2626549 RepID=UPI00023ED5FE|nr:MULTISPECIES: DUF4262 domain-containing protein [unclassified Actinoplanes]AEV84479.1 hypothetical protein ACPL_3584 [Actinoplanes sp. SE50/110]ATO82871.1 hypothetical protein ACWT_3456 [Actinoplanes sp. SE50]SLM00279.1 hypothetical protein ACSP50_3511 [Actinoplanes sp. SE50/110]